ncbi:hypothetical protein ANOM_003336, partial [Aspergillus nomiae NRRL 13137]
LTRYRTSFSWREKRKGKLKKKNNWGNNTLAIQRRSETIVPTSYSIAPASRKSLILWCPQGRFSAPPLDPASLWRKVPIVELYQIYLWSILYLYANLSPPSMTQGNFSFHHRRSPSGSYAPKLRTARPALHRKGTSFVNHSISKLGAGHTRHSESDNECQFEMAASFLNFCAMCERQITIPDNSRLYCSERYVARLIMTLSSSTLAQPPCLLFISRSMPPSTYLPPRFT